MIPLSYLYLPQLAYSTEEASSLSLVDTARSFRTRKAMEIEPLVPPGFRFHPTEEELVGYYLNRKVNSLKIDIDVIVDLDLYTIEPWDIQDRCGLGYEEENEWYFFSHKDKKYPTGKRTNRATAAGFWKATGRDKAVISNNVMIGMRKTLVFYNGRAPNGRKSEWIMHEYRLQSTQYEPPQEEGWVVCRAFKKPIPNQKQHFETWNPYTYNDSEKTKFVPLQSLNQVDSANFQNHDMSFPRSRFALEHNRFIEQLPQNQDSPSTSSPTKGCDDSYECKDTALLGHSNFFQGDLLLNDDQNYGNCIYMCLPE